MSSIYIIIKLKRGDNMDFEFENFKVQGIKFNYYFVCKRKLWLFNNGISMEENSDRVSQGKFIHENSYKKKEENKEKLIDGLIKLDILEENEVREVKISSKMKESDKMQLLYYLYYLDKIGIKRTGTINYVTERKIEKVELTEENKKYIEKILVDIKKILNMEKPPTKIKYPYCKKCSYYEFCYVEEV